jgi:hypothetical protein
MVIRRWVTSMQSLTRSSWLEIEVGSVIGQNLLV